MTPFSIKHSLGLAAGLVLALSLSLPVAAFDTGGGGDAAPAASTAQPATPTLAQARADIAASKWPAAIGKLKLILAASPNNADALNLMGRSLRETGDTKRALQFYLKALKIDPSHTGALEYLGELYVQLGQPAKAEANLVKIKSICGTSCEEYKDLAKLLG